MDENDARNHLKTKGNSKKNRKIRTFQDGCHFELFIPHLLNDPGAVSSRDTKGGGEGSENKNGGKKNKKILGNEKNINKVKNKNILNSNENRERVYQVDM